MRRLMIVSAALSAVVAGSALAQDPGGPHRRFTEIPIDPNRNNKIVYVPVAWAMPGPRPTRGAYDVSVASWYQRSIGARGAKPDKVLDKAEYVLEEFSAARGMMRVVVTRRGGPVEAAPEIRVVHEESSITARALPQVQPVADGVRYTFNLEIPPYGFAPSGTIGSDQRFELRFMSSRQDTPLPPGIARRATFGGDDPEVRALTAPPQLPRTERVAGKRIEYRSARDGGTVVTDPKVAGRRQELRSK